MLVVKVQKQCHRYRGAIRQSRHYYLRWTRPDGKRTWLRLCPDKRESERMAREFLAKEAARRLGLTDEMRDAARLPIERHVTDFEAHMRASRAGTLTAVYVTSLIRVIRNLIQQCRFATAESIDGLRVERALTKAVEGGLSLNTRNQRLGNMRHFTAWLTEHRRLRHDPLVAIKRVSIETDRRRVRRSLTPVEFFRLLEVTQKEPDWCGLTGHARALCYYFATNTGLRSREIATVTWASFDFGPEPTVTVAAARSKNRRQAVLPIRQDLTAEFQRWWHERGDDRDARVWAIPPTGQTGYRTAAMLRRDLAAAGIEYRDANGKVLDFHALRSSYVTWLLRNGASEHHVRKLARHSTLDLTVNTYSKVQATDLRAELERLPAIPVPTKRDGKAAADDAA